MDNEGSRLNKADLKSEDPYTYTLIVVVSRDLPKTFVFGALVEYLEKKGMVHPPPRKTRAR
jgi:hypothetical protein